MSDTNNEFVCPRGRRKCKKTVFYKCKICKVIVPCILYNMTYGMCFACLDDVPVEQKEGYMKNIKRSSSPAMIRCNNRFSDLE